jgi:hypothetical protein
MENMHQLMFDMANMGGNMHVLSDGQIREMAAWLAMKMRMSNEQLYHYSAH